MFRNKEKIRRIILNAKRITVEKINSSIIINLAKESDDAYEIFRNSEKARKDESKIKLIELGEEISTLKSRDSVEKTFDELLIIVRSSIVETNNVETNSKMKTIKHLITKSSFKISDELENLYSEYVEIDFLENRIENILDMIELTKQITNIANHLYPKEVQSLTIYLNLTLSQEDLLKTILEEIWKFTRYSNNNLKLVIPIGKKLTIYGKYLQTTNIVDAKRTAYDEIFTKVIEEIEKKIKRLFDKKFEEKVYGSPKWRELTKVISNLQILSDTFNKLSNNHNVTSFFDFLRANDSNLYFPIFKKVHGDVIRRMCEIVNVQICRLRSLYYKTESADDRNQLAIYSSVMIEKLINIVSKFDDIISIDGIPELLVIKFNHDHINIENRLRDMIVNRIFVPINYMVPHDIDNIRELARILRACRVRLENIVAQRETSNIKNNGYLSSSSESSDDDDEEGMVEKVQRVEEGEKKEEEQQQVVDEERLVEGKRIELVVPEQNVEVNDTLRSSNFSSPASSRNCIFFSFSSNVSGENQVTDSDKDEFSEVIIIDNNVKPSSLASFEGKSGGQSTYDTEKIEDEICDHDDNAMIIDNTTTDGEIGDASSSSSSGNSSRLDENRIVDGTDSNLQDFQTNGIDFLWNDATINHDNNNILRMLFCDQNSCLLSHKLVELDANNFGKLYSTGKSKYSNIFPTICRHCLKSKFGLYEDCVNDNDAFSNCVVTKENVHRKTLFLKGFKAIPSLVNDPEKVFESMTIILPSGKLLLEMLMTDPEILYNSNKIIPTYKIKKGGQSFFLNPYIYGYFKHIHDIVTDPSKRNDPTSTTCNYRLSPMQLLQASSEIDALVMSQLIEPGGKFSSYVKTGKSVFIEKDKVLKIKILLDENITAPNDNDDDISILIENKINNNITTNPSQIKIQNLNAILSTYTYSTRMAIKNSKEKLKKYFSSDCESSAVELFVSSFCFPSIITLRPNSDEIYQRYRPNCKYLPGIGLISLTSICSGDLLIIERSISVDTFTNTQRLIYDEERQYPTKKRKITNSVEILPFKKVCLYYGL